LKRVQLKEWRHVIKPATFSIDIAEWRALSECRWTCLISTSRLQFRFDDIKLGSEVPHPIRKIVEQHVAGRLPAKILAKLRDLRARGAQIGSDPAFFHFGGGVAVRNLCRERLNDRDLAACCLFGDWDRCYIEVLAGIAATPVRTWAVVSTPRPRQLSGLWIAPSTPIIVPMI
jgi:hypothetical protein